MWMLVTVMCFLCCHMAYANLDVIVEQRQYEIRSYPELEKILRQSSERGNFEGTSGGHNDICSCSGYTCGCCLHLEVAKIGLNDTGCVNISYLPDEYGLELDFVLDGYIVFKEKVSARNPPPICGEIPYVHKLASLCLRFYNLTISGKQFSGCADIEVRFEGVLIKTFDFGCFHIPPSTVNASRIMAAGKAANRWRELSYDQVKP